MFKKIPYCITGIELGEHGMYIGQSKKKCFKFSRAAPHRQDESDTIPTRNKSKFKNEAEFLS
jgi:hypothetical protein